ncbi:hypothetical protein SAMN05443247_07625 [Bradyrhizobium erythrophlei]|nr:hypothetical protein SAMN05443247_07625 [Bradyrhizobium erythrophlei]
MAKYRQSATQFILDASDFSCVSDDPMAPDRIAYVAWLAAGNTPDPFIPLSVSPRQARLALSAAGLLDRVTSTVASADQATQITWEFATQIDRNSPLIATLGASLGLTPTQIDALFIQAATL